MEHFQSVSSHSLYILVDVFQIIPPKQWTPMSKHVPDDFVLEHVFMQTRSELSHGGWEIINTEMESMTYRDYVTANDTKFFDEDRFWASDAPLRKNMHSIDNNLSLFGNDVQLCNLSKLTKTHSNIHETKPEKVSNNWLLFCLSLFTNENNSHGFLRKLELSNECEYVKRHQKSIVKGSVRR